jgi:hypothetical protein
MIRSERGERGSRAGSVDAASPSMITRPGRTYDPATMSPNDVDRGRRAIPRSEFGRPGGDAPTRTDTPTYRLPGIYDRRPPSTTRPSSVSPGGGDRRAPSGPPPAAAQPGRSGPPPSAGTPPAGGRTRPSGGASQGTAVRRPGGGRN